MKFFLTSLGTRGDIEPFLAIGELLLNHDHDVIYCFPEQFEYLISGSIPFYPITPQFIRLIESREGRMVMGKASLWQKANALFKLYKKGKIVNEKVINTHFEALQYEKPDCVIHHPKCSFPVFWNLKTKIKSIILSPVPFVFHRVEKHPHIGFPLFYNSMYCRLTYKLAQWAWINSIYNSQKNLKGFQRYSKTSIRSELSNSPFIYSVSPQLFKRPNSWPGNVQILGYHERDTTIKWTPHSELEQFLQKHSKVVFLTFGSMVNHDPKFVSKLFYETMTSLKIPCIINTASGGLMSFEPYKNSDDFLFVEDIPYKWILQRVYAVIHHGGSGTTHMSLQYGLPQLIIPHIVDQFMWDSVIYDEVLGPKGISIKKVTKGKLRERISELYTNKNFKKNAVKICYRMTEKDMEDELYSFIIDKVGM